MTSEPQARPGTVASVATLEKAVDAEYQALFATHRGWEAAMLTALLIYELQTCDVEVEEGVQLADSLKYAAMHYSRWGQLAGPRPLSGLPVALDVRALREAASALAHAHQYVGVWFAFVAAHSGICTVTDVSERTLTLRANPRWFAYDALDAQLHGERLKDESLAAGGAVLGPAFRPLLAAKLSSHQGTISAYPLALTPEETAKYEEIIYGSNHFLPDTWQMDGVPISTIRLFWAALSVMAGAHSVAAGASDLERASVARLMTGSRREWIVRMQALTGANSGVINYLLDLHSLKSGKMSDPALTPLLDIGSGWLVASPQMVLTAGFERNFSALVARSPQHKKSYDALSSYFSSNLAREVAAALRARGFRVATEFQFQSSLGASDFDILVWDAARRHLLAIELKAMIKTADFKEVLNRGEATCREACRTQLPKYKAAIVESAGHLLESAFGIAGTTPARIDCLLTVQGFVGTARLEAEPFAVVNDRLLKAWLGEGRSLATIMDLASSRAYLPAEGRDYQMLPREILTPGGRTIFTHDWEPLALRVAGKGRQRRGPR